ncbi:MAG: CoA pyrophosphatase [Euryarchaeota archaeon]|nr:CoA pyrophosphatase [Euryarchaeota archaeon]
MPEDDAVATFEDEVRRFRRAVLPGHAGDPLPGRASAVLAPLVPTDIGMCLLLERRPLGPERFAGHLGFPGGRIEPEDTSPLAAALRESEEEIGFTPEDVEVLGHLVDTTDPRDRPVAAFVGLVPLAAVPREAASPAEVAEMILVPVADLRAAGPTPEADPNTIPGDAGRPPHLYRATGYEARRHPEVDRVVHYWPLTGAETGRTAMLWGFTAGLTALLLERVYGWSPPRAPRVVEAWEEMVP